MSNESLQFRWENIQSKMTTTLKESCLFFCLCIVAEQFLNQKIDFVSIFLKSLRQGWLKSDGTVTDSLSILHELTGYKWQRKIYSPGVVIHTDFEYYLIQKWENEKGGNHFRLKEFDIWENSQTVKNGKLVEIYAYALADRKGYLK